jgi:drug/metabolite transporter (DMT)-like permease
VIGVLGGLAAALLWGLSTVCGSRSSRLLGAHAALAWVLAVGLLTTAPLAVASGWPADADALGWSWTALAGLGSLGGLAFMYRALARGQVSIVTPLISAQGAFAAVVAWVAGEPLAGLAAVGLAVVALGMVAASQSPAARDDRPASGGVVASLLSALCFGFALYASARGGEAVGAAWLVASVRVLGVAAVTAPLALRGRLPRPGSALPWVLVGGVAEVVAYLSFVVAADVDGVVVPAVIGSQFGLVASLIGVFVLGERLGRLQAAGVLAVLGGVALVTAVQA